MLDLDFDQGFVDMDAFLEAIGLGGVHYVLHHSSSAGITSAIGLRTHVFMQLATPVVPAQLKLWLRHLNLTVPGLREQVRLSANGMTLRYPLDIVSNQNDRLIFVADPLVQGLEDPLAGRRFELHERGASHLALSTCIRMPCSAVPRTWSQSSGRELACRTGCRGTSPYPNANACWRTRNPRP